MTGVRNGPLVQLATTVGGQQTIATVGTGLTWLIKTIHLYNAGLATASVAVALLSRTGSVFVVVVPTTDVPVNGPLTWEGWTAAGPGDQIVLFAPIGVSVWLSGAELPGTIT